MGYGCSLPTQRHTANLNDAIQGWILVVSYEHETPIWEIFEETIGGDNPGQVCMKGGRLMLTTQVSNVLWRQVAPLLTGHYHWQYLAIPSLTVPIISN